MSVKLPILQSRYCSDPADGFCGYCRQRAHGRAWRRSRMAKFDVGGADADFACPKGKPWIEDSRPPGGAVTRPAGTAPTAQSAIATAAHGLIGILRAATGTGGADGVMIVYRTGICGQCDQAEKVAGVLQRCKACGCSTWAKIRNASELCPLGKW